MTSPLIRSLDSGAVDIVGDVHGEVDALHELIAALGYDRAGVHPKGRKLVFVGDLCDRGTDSPRVVELVGELVDKDLAYCVIGNHELNLLRGSRKEGNGWAYECNHDIAEGKFVHARDADAGQRVWITSFLSTLPLALERQDLRIIHACWNTPSVDSVRAAGPIGLLTAYNSFADIATRASDASDLPRRAALERAQYGESLNDPSQMPPFLPAISELDEAEQMANPICVLTSGVERQAKKPFFANGKWRMVERVAWWDEYTDPPFVVFGHYWRTNPGDHSRDSGDDLFSGMLAGTALGPRGNAYCVDFSVGKRFKERLHGLPITSRLTALRWPERTIMFDTGETMSVS